MRTDIEEWRIEGWENPSQRSGWESVVVTSIDSEENREYEGRDVAEIARTEGREPIDVVCDLLYEEELGVSMIVHLLTEEDVRTIMQNERVGVATDGLFGGKPHPRTYATYPRILSTYVREENLLTLEEAVRKMTSLPARAMDLQEKGLVRPGMDADLVVFDPALVDTRATFDDPRQFPRGMPHVIVDGEFVVRDGETTGATPGDAIRK